MPATPSQRPHKEYRQLTDEEWRKLNGEYFKPQELIKARGEDTFEEALEKLVLTARWRIAGIFKEEVCLYRGKSRPTDNYIILRNRLDFLVQYLVLRMRRPIACKYDLAERWRNVSPKVRDKVLRKTDEMLVIAALMQMQGANQPELWYDHKLGAWQIVQHCIDEPRAVRKRASRTLRGIKKYHDDRTYHGRNGKQWRKRNKELRVHHSSTGQARSAS